MALVDALIQKKVDAISNACYKLCVAIIRQDPNLPANKAALAALHEMTFADKKPSINEAIIQDVLDDVTSVLMDNELFDPNAGPANPELSDETVLPKNQFDAESISTCLDMLLDYHGYSVCNPHYNGKTLCIYGTNCPHPCSFKTTFTS